jgi:UDP-N-acetylglucosamine transferase subunit ALG13
MILISVGSTQFPFARMNALAGRLSEQNTRKEKIIFQYGALSPQYYYPPISLHAFIMQDKLLEYMKAARVIICHGGPGTIYQSLSFGKIPWVFPRKQRFGEHLTDHQVEFCAFMAKRNLVKIISDNTPITSIIKGSPMTTPVQRHNQSLVRYLDTLMNI